MENLDELFSNLKNKENLSPEIISQLAKIQKAKLAYDNAMYFTQNLVSIPDSGLGILMNGHSIEKLAAELEGVAHRENMPEVEALAKRLG